MSFDPRRLIFLIGPPRGGTTLLSRMLHAHPQIYAGPEPHLITPLVHLGYFGRVQKAPYDPVQTARAHRALVASLPGGEQDYLDAMRAMPDTLYGRLLQNSGRTFLVDKTPAYALVLPTLLRLYPRARYLVLTRHPFAVWCSYARTFFDDDWAFAHAHNPVIERYVPAIANLLRAPPPSTDIHALTYEALLADPSSELRRICDWLGLDHPPTMQRYGESSPPPAGLGDPSTVRREVEPIPTHATAWAETLRDRPARRAMLERMVRHLDEEDLRAWGTPRDQLWAPLKTQPSRPPRPSIDRHLIERKALLMLRRRLRGSRAARALDRARFAIDVLLRDNGGP